MSNLPIFYCNRKKGRDKMNFGLRCYSSSGGAQRTKFLKNVHKPPLRANFINFELNGFNASIWVPWSPSDPKKM